MSKKEGSDIKKEINQASNNYLLHIIMLCTFVIVISNFVFSFKIVNDVHKIINDNEYSKVGGEENYKMIKEIQKDQMLNYLKDLSKNDPNYIGQIKKKLEGGEDESVSSGTLSKEDIISLKSNSYISGNTGADLSVIEFSDLQCEFCKKFNNDQVIEKVVSEKPDEMNFIFKNIPIEGNEVSLFLARAGKCISSKTGGKRFPEYLKEVYAHSGSMDNETASGFVYALAESYDLDKPALQSCISSQEVAANVDKEIGESIFLKIKKAPSIMILNNKTGRYEILQGDSSEEEIAESAERMKQ